MEWPGDQETATCTDDVKLDDPRDSGRAGDDKFGGDGGNEATNAAIRVQKAWRATAYAAFDLCIRTPR